MYTFRYELINGHSYIIHVSSLVIHVIRMSSLVILMSSLKIYGNFAFLVTSAVCMARPGSLTTILLSMFPKTGWQCRHKQAKAGSKGWYNVKRDVTSASKRSIRMFVITEKAPTRAFSWLKAAVLNKMWMYLKCLPLLVTTQCCRPAR